MCVCLANHLTIVDDNDNELMMVMLTSVVMGNEIIITLLTSVVIEYIKIDNKSVPELSSLSYYK